MLTLAAYSLDLPAYACARLRVLGPAARLGGRLRLRWGAASDGADYALDASAMEGADVVLFQRHFPMEATWPLVERALASGLPVIHDVDDNFLAVPPHHPMAARLAPVLPYLRELAARATLVTAATPELARAFKALTPRVAVLPNFLDERLWAARVHGRTSQAAPPASPHGPDFPASDPARAASPAPRGGDTPVRIAHAATPSHAADLAEVAVQLRRVKRRYGRAVEFVFLGPAPEGLEAASIPFAEDYAAYARTLLGLAPDIALAPLADTPFNRCKSAVKWLEYSAAGAAGVYSDSPAYSCVRHGQTGLVVGPEGWEQAIARLVEDAPLRLAMAARARAEVLSRWTLARGAEACFRIWERVARGR